MDIHVMHVPGAWPQRDAIVKQLSEEADVCVHEDPERKGLAPNWLGGLEHILDNPDKPKWAVILQDDAQPLPGWQDHLEKACWYSPSPVLGLTYFGKHGEKAADSGAPYMVGRGILWGGGVALRRDFTEGLYPWAKKIYEETGYPHDDRYLIAYAERIGKLPALVSRAIFGQPVMQSLMGHSRRDGVTWEPTRTIEGVRPNYGVLPRYARKTVSCDKDQIEWLKRYDTEAAVTDYTYESRGDRVRKVPLG